uniref:Uncharacterized protein n=1 Tax=Cannabis sativa TaxID=3483 RepID=A0A803R233_CANSA
MCKHSCILSVRLGLKEITIHEDGNFKSISFKEVTNLISGTFGGNNLNDLDLGQEIKFCGFASSISEGLVLFEDFGLLALSSVSGRKLPTRAKGSCLLILHCTQF